MSPSNKPKRSKSLAARFRAGRKNPNNPLTDDTTVVTCAEDGREAAQAHSVPVSPLEERRPYRDWPASSPMSLNGSRGPSAGMDGGVEQLEARTAAIEFDENGLSAPMSRTATDDGSVTASPTTGKKEKGGLKRLFSTKRKVGLALLSHSMRPTADLVRACRADCRRYREGKVAGDLVRTARVAG